MSQDIQLKVRQYHAQRIQCQTLAFNMLTKLVKFMVRQTEKE